MRKRLAIITTHPIQYNGPLFKLLNNRGNIDLKVFYTWGDSILEDKYDPGFAKSIKWDIPLLDGYPYEFLENSSNEKGSHHFNGIINPEIIEKIDAYDPNALLVFGWSFKSHLKVLRHYHRKKKILFRGDSTWISPGGFFKNTVRRIFLKWVYRHIDYALYVGTENRKYFEISGLKDEQLIFAPHAVDNERFEWNSNERDNQAMQWRNKLGIGNGEIVYLYAGKLEWIKNIDFLLEVFSEWHPESESHLVIVGNGILEEELKRKYQSNKSIHFVDFQNQTIMPIIYRIGDVFILCSHSETWGLSVNEAMACGRPVLIGDHCGCAPDLVKEGKNGYSFQSGNHKDLLDKLVKLNLPNDSLNRMGLESLKVVSNFSFSHICDAIESTVNKN